jgi:hypothetical protein
MVTYIYFVKCPNCEDEHFDFFDDAKAFARGCMSKKPIITQTEVERNDFGECTDSADLGQIWSWEDEMEEPEAEPETKFSKDDVVSDYDPDTDPEFTDDDFFAVNDDLYESVKISFTNNADRDEFFKLCSEIGIVTGADLKKFMDEVGADDSNILAKLREYRAELGDDFKIEECQRKPIPDGMTIEQLVETMQENEDMVECAGCEELFPKDECFHKDDIGWLCGDCEDRIVKCTWCEELYDKSECRYEVDLGWLCSRCEAAIKSRGETLTFREGNYWDFLDEDVEELHDLGNTYDGGYPETRTWMCYLNGNDLGTVEATTEEEAYLKMEQTWPEYRYNNEDVQVIPVDELEESTSKVDTLEEATDYRKRLTTCPECGSESYDAETSFCLKCGFN